MAVGDVRWGRVNVCVADSVADKVAMDGEAVVDPVRVMRVGVVVGVTRRVPVCGGERVSVGDADRVLEGPIVRVLVTVTRMEAVILELAVGVRDGAGVLECVGVCVCVLDSGADRVTVGVAVGVLDGAMLGVAVRVGGTDLDDRDDAEYEGLADCVRDGGWDLVPDGEADCDRVARDVTESVGEEDVVFVVVVVAVCVRVFVVVFVEVVEAVAVLEVEGDADVVGVADCVLETRVTVAAPVERIVVVGRIERVDVVDGHGDRVRVTVFVLVFEVVVVDEGTTEPLAPSIHNKRSSIPMLCSKNVFMR